MLLGIVGWAQVPDATDSYPASLRSAALQGDLPWHLDALPTEAAAKSAIHSLRMREGPNTIVVAVIDSGLIPGHPALANGVLPGYDMAATTSGLRQGRSADTAPDSRDARCANGGGMSASVHTHGTEVAGLIAGNGYGGMWGVNPGAKVLPVRLFGACPIARRDLLDSIEWAAGYKVRGVPANDTPAKVINMSFTGGAEVCGADLQETIDRVTRKGVFVVAAAGNSFHKPLYEPANCHGVISVGALDAENKIQGYSALDVRTTLYAPGGGKKLQTTGTWAQNKIKVATFEPDLFGVDKPVTKYTGVGTSYAAPIVSGWIALWLSNFPNKTAADFFSDMSQYLQEVETVDACAECRPKGLVTPHMELSQ